MAMTFGMEQEEEYGDDKKRSSRVSDKHYIMDFILNCKNR